MNCESWLEPKNSLIAATTGRALIRLADVTVAASVMVMRSLMIRSMRIRPMRNWFCSSSPTARTRRLPRWSMSSASPVPLLSAISLRMIETKSWLSSTRRSRSWARSRASSSGTPRFLSSLKRPTLERSKRRPLKNSELSRLRAFSTVGGSPGRILRYSSISASSTLVVVSFSSVAAMYWCSGSTSCSAKNDLMSSLLA